jgi:type II secretory pathway pseudopilin PulG
MVVEGRTPVFGSKREEAGFTLGELLIIMLIVGIRSAVALPLYLGYTRDARLAEAKALAGSALTALSGCVQVKGAGGNCVRSEVAQRVGLDTSSFNTRSPGRGIGHEEAFPAPDAASGQPGRAPASRPRRLATRVMPSHASLRPASRLSALRKAARARRSTFAFS